MRHACLALVVTLAACAQPVSFDGTTLSPALPAANFTLVDQTGHRWSLDAQRGTNVALYFGYIHCADTCPLTLAKLSRAIAALGTSRSHAEIAFVTVDPARDTPSALAAYLRRFKGAKIVGLTGTQAALERVYTAYHVWAQRIPGYARGGDYAVAHASPVFLIDARGVLRVVHDDSDTVSAFTHDLRALGA